MDYCILPVGEWRLLNTLKPTHLQSINLDTNINRKHRLNMAICKGGIRVREHAWMLHAACSSTETEMLQSTQTLQIIVYMHAQHFWFFILTIYNEEYIINLCQQMRTMHWFDGHIIRYVYNLQDAGVFYVVFVFVGNVTVMALSCL